MATLTNNFLLSLNTAGEYEHVLAIDRYLIWLYKSCYPYVTGFIVWLKPAPAGIYHMIIADVVSHLQHSLSASDTEQHQSHIAVDITTHH